MRAWLVVAALSALLVAGCTGAERSTSASGAGKVTELKSVETLKTSFNADAGKPRLLLLLSPT